MLGGVQRTVCMHSVACGSAKAGSHAARAPCFYLTGRQRPASFASQRHPYNHLSGTKANNRQQQRQPRRRCTVCSSAAADLPLPNPDGGALHFRDISLPSCSHTNQAHLPRYLPAGTIPFNPYPEGSAFLAKIKGLLFYLFTLALSIPLFISMLVMTPFVLLLDKHR